MVAFLAGLSPVLQGLCGTVFTWLMTAAGALPVFFTKTLNRKTMNLTLGLAAGVMIAASFWSLLGPAIEMSGGSWVPATVGFVLGALVLRGIDYVLPHLHSSFGVSGEAEGLSTSWRRSVLLVLAVTLHNLPEGLSVGVAFGAAAQGLHGVTMGHAIALALGIGLQNLPEGLAVAMPLRSENLSRLKSFWYGQLSGMVEPLGGVLGAWLVTSIRSVMPYALAFAAGAMIFVVVEDLLPEGQRDGDPHLVTTGVILGFALMMVLDVVFA